MIYNYPFYNYPFYRRNYRYPPRNFYTQVPESILSAEKACEVLKNTTSNETRKDNSQAPLLEIFGIQLFFDDILLVCLIFFLYNEGVKDQNLFISLILLLLS